MPERIFIRHDLPAPFSPTIASTSPELSSNWTPLRAWTPGNDLAIPETSRRALTAGSRVRPKTPRRKVGGSPSSAIVGENGAGKSCLMKILSGIYTRDAGTIILDGKEVHIDNPRAAQRLGVSIVHQE